MRRTVTKSIAIIGEGETEWFYFDSFKGGETMRVKVRSV